MTIDATEAQWQGYPAIVYTVTDKQPYVELLHTKKDMPEFELTQNEDEVKITVPVSGTSNRYIIQEPTIRIYGPALDEFTVQGGDAKYTNDSHQGKIIVNSVDAASLYVAGSFEFAEVHTEATASVDLEESAVRDLQVIIDGGSVGAGVVRTLSVQQPDACPALSKFDNTVEVESVSSGEITYNGEIRQVQTTQTIRSACSVLTIGNDEDI